MESARSESSSSSSCCHLAQMLSLQQFNRFACRAANLRPLKGAVFEDSADALPAASPLGQCRAGSQATAMPATPHTMGDQLVIDLSDCGHEHSDASSSSAADGGSSHRQPLLQKGTQLPTTRASTRVRKPPQQFQLPTGSDRYHTRQPMSVELSADA